MRFLEQSTTVTVMLGPFVDFLDGVTAETGIAATMSPRVSKAGAAFAARSSTTAEAHDENGFYRVELNATDTNTVGPLIVAVTAAATHAPVWAEFMVLPSAAYDAIVSGTGNGIRADVQQLAANSITDTAIATDAIGSSELAASAVSEIQSGLATTAALATVDGNVDAILVDTAALDGRVPTTPATEANVSAVGAAVTALNDPTAVENAIAVWDRVLTGGTHNIVNSAGRRLRILQENQGYETGAIWIDTVNGTAGTTDYENGTVDNPVDTIADANTLAASLGISRFQVAPGSSITFAAAQSNQSFYGSGWTLALGGQSIAGSHIEGATVSGTGTGSGFEFMRCEIGAVTVADGALLDCSLAGTLTASAAGDYYLNGCYSAVAGSGTPTFDFGAAVLGTNLSVRHYSGGLQIDNKDAAGTDLMSLEGNGQLVVAASSGGAISVRGNFRVTNTGGATITYDDASQAAIDHTARFDGIEGATFDTATDSLEAIRNRGDTAWVTGAGGSPITAQEVRDAMKLAPTAGAPAAGSVDEHLDNAALEATVGALNDLSQAEAQTASTNALNAYDPPTNTELTAVQTALEARFTGIEGATFDTATDSNEAIRDRGDAAWVTGGGGASLTAQEIRDAMKLAPTVGAPAAGSVDEHLDTIETDTAALDGRVPATPATEANVTAVGSAVVALNDLSQAEAQAGAAAALTAYDPPTNTELSAVQTALEARFTGVEGATFDTATDSLEAIANGGGGGGLTAQQVRDALKLAPSAGAPAAGSIDEELDKLLGLSLGQYYLDNITYDGNGFPTSQRLRVFDGAKDMTTVTAGAANGTDGEIARVDLVSSPVSGTVRAETVRGSLT